MFSQVAGRKQTKTAHGDGFAARAFGFGRVGSLSVSQRLGDKVEQRFGRSIAGQSQAFIELGMVRLPGGEACDRNSRAFEATFEALGLRAGVGMISNVQDEEGRNAL